MFPENGRANGFLGSRMGFVDTHLWGLYAHVYDTLPRYYKPYQKLLESVVSSVEACVPRGGKILDAGCGTGNFSIELGQRGYDVDGIDMSREMLRRAKQKKTGRLNIGKFREWDIEKGLSLYPDATFDCVISIHTLYILQEPHRAIREYFRVLKPAGHLIIAEPRFPIMIVPIAKEIYRDGGLSGLIKLLVTQAGVGICNLFIGHRLRNGSYHHWSEGALMSLLEGAFFRLEYMVPAYAAGSDLLAAAVKPAHCFEMNGYRFFDAKSSQDLEKGWRLRYQVYCVELGFEPANASELERDLYDDYAINFLAVDKSDRAVGTMRFVYNNPKGFPMDTDFPLTDYARANGISRALEGGRFVLCKDIDSNARLTVAFGLFKCLYHYCCEIGIQDIFTVTHPKILKKYSMPGVKAIGEPFRYSKPLTGGLWVPVHCNIREAYESYLKGFPDCANVP